MLDAIVCTDQELMDPDRWQQLVLQFRQDNFKLHQLSTNSVFYVVLQAGLSALKTPYPLLTCCRDTVSDTDDVTS